MSADNGVYIGRFPIDNSDEFEYRVLETTNIEDCDYVFDKDEATNKKLQDCTRVAFWLGADRFNNEKEALAHAKRIYLWLDICEYGICHISYDRPLIDMTREVANEIIAAKLAEDNTVRYDSE